MRNGMYKYKHKHLNDEVYVKADNGKLTLHRLDSINGDKITLDYIGRIEEDALKSDYQLLCEVKFDQKWCLRLYRSGKCVEELLKNVNFGFAVTRKNELMRTTHKTGLLIVERYGEGTVVGPA